MILLGIGFTTARLAKRLLARGGPVYGVARQPSRFSGLRALGLRLQDFERGALPANSTVIHTIPPLASEERVKVRRFLEELNPSRVIYISATSVYGEQVEVDEKTAAAPADARGMARDEEERWLLRHGWSNLIIRPAAIYGPGRGAHVKALRGELARSADAQVVSRIHVDDLAAVLEAGAGSDLEGAWPLADEYPCASREIVQFCARLFTQIRQVPQIEMAAGSATLPGAGRRADGRAIRELLGVELAYATFESGVLASLAEERVARGGTWK